MNGIAVSSIKLEQINPKSWMASFFTLDAEVRALVVPTTDVGKTVLWYWKEKHYLGVPCKSLALENIETPYVYCTLWKDSALLQ